MDNWWNDLEFFEQLLWGIACLFSLLFLVQNILSMFGGDHGEAEGHSDDSVSDDDGIDYQFFTVRNLVAFLTMFGWAGLGSYSMGMSKPVTIIIASGSGLALVLVMVFLVATASKLKESGTVQLKNALRKSGETYLPIPPKRSGIGKVQIQIQGRLRELDAMTDENESISRGKMVTVVEILNNNILLVSSQQ